jgi:hypothetical protein
MQMKLSTSAFTPAAQGMLAKAAATVSALNVPELGICATDMVMHGVCGPLSLIEGGLGALYVLAAPNKLPFLRTWGLGELGKAAGYGLMALGAPHIGLGVLLVSMACQAYTTGRSYTEWKDPNAHQQPSRQISLTLPALSDLTSALSKKLWKAPAQEAQVHAPEADLPQTEPTPKRLAAPVSNPFDPQRLAHVGTLLTAGFRFNGPSSYLTPFDVCSELGQGYALTLSLPGSSVEHALPTCADFDADGMVMLAEVRERGNRMLEGSEGPQPGTVELHHAKSIVGDYSEETLAGYLRSMAGTPDATSADAARQAFRGQVSLLDQGVAKLESQARREALGQMAVQTQFLTETLGIGSTPSLLATAGSRLR